jgi:hypothetical protein
LQLSIVVIARRASAEAIQNFFVSLDCVASLAMTVTYTFTFSRRDWRPSFANTLSLFGLRGRREDRVSTDTHGPRASKKARGRTTGSAKYPAFPAQWLYGVLRALPGAPGFLATVCNNA